MKWSLPSCFTLSRMDGPEPRTFVSNTSSWPLRPPGLDQSTETRWPMESRHSPTRLPSSMLPLSTFVRPSGSGGVRVPLSSAAGSAGPGAAAAAAAWPALAAAAAFEKGAFTDGAAAPTAAAATGAPTGAGAVELPSAAAAAGLPVPMGVTAGLADPASGAASAGNDVMVGLAAEVPSSLVISAAEGGYHAPGVLPPAASSRWLGGSLAMAGRQPPDGTPNAPPTCGGGPA
mmetsp:Transcript_102987/g.317742  ORF Transcript_102987/g.317742 Transcript_102987/m.317742 type:complete len:231 (-) Transcript_102987:251-943(-)